MAEHWWKRDSNHFSITPKSVGSMFALSMLPLSGPDVLVSRSSRIKTWFLCLEQTKKNISCFVDSISSSAEVLLGDRLSCDNLELLLRWRCHCWKNPLAWMWLYVNVWIFWVLEEWEDDGYFGMKLSMPVQLPPSFISPPSCSLESLVVPGLSYSWYHIQ